jgi:hypothetical protein
MNKQCPNGHRMRELQSKCSACGWEESAFNEEKHTDHNCAWTGCPLLGSLTDSRGGKGAIWYCDTHFFNRNDPMFCQTVTGQFQRGELLPEKKHWSDILMEEKMEELRKTNPELFFKPRSQAEKDDYQAMMVNFIRSLRATQKPLPYKKTRKQDYDENALIYNRATVELPPDEAAA